MPDAYACDRGPAALSLCLPQQTLLDPLTPGHLALPSCACLANVPTTMVDSNYDDGRRCIHLAPPEVNTNGGSAVATITPWAKSATEMVHPRWRT